MTWMASNLIIQIVARILGAHGAAAAAHDHRFGWLGHTLAGLAGGAASGLFLQTFAATIVTASGSLGEPTAAENAMVQALTGLCAGGIAMLAIGLVHSDIKEAPDLCENGGFAIPPSEETGGGDGVVA